MPVNPVTGSGVGVGACTVTVGDGVTVGGGEAAVGGGLVGVGCA